MVYSLNKALRLSLVVSIFLATFFTGACASNKAPEGGDDSSLENSEGDDEANSEDPANNANSNSEDLANAGDGSAEGAPTNTAMPPPSNSAEMPPPANAPANAAAPANATAIAAAAPQNQAAAPAPAPNPNDTREVRFIERDDTPVFQSPNDTATKITKLSQGDAVVVVLQGDWAQIGAEHFIHTAALSKKAVPRGFVGAVWQEAAAAAMPAPGSAAPAPANAAGVTANGAPANPGAPSNAAAGPANAGVPANAAAPTGNHANGQPAPAL